MRGTHAWGVIAAFVLGYEVYAARRADGNLLSEIYDLWIERHPVLARIPVVLLAMHLINAWPDDRLDVVSFEFWRMLRRCSTKRSGETYLSTKVTIKHQTVAKLEA